jgi:hypothetical protein
MTLIIPPQIGLLANGLFDLIGPFLIFGVYIIASIAKAAAKKGQAGNSDEETESELKKAVRRRYQEIHQKQIGKVPQAQKPFRHMERPVQQAPAERQPHRSQWELRQETIRERNAKNQTRQIGPKRPQESILKQVSAGVSQSKSKQLMHQKTAKTDENGPKQTGNLLVSMIKEPGNLRSAIVLKEILDKPLALREL